ncbi:hypothetical protein ABZP36_023619 [Zizania latifolia]
MGRMLYGSPETAAPTEVAAAFGDTRSIKRVGTARDAGQEEGRPGGVAAAGLLLFVLAFHCVLSPSLGNGGVGDGRCCLLLCSSGFIEEELDVPLNQERALSKAMVLDWILGSPIACSCNDGAIWAAEFDGVRAAGWRVSTNSSLIGSGQPGMRMGIGVGGGLLPSQSPFSSLVVPRQQFGDNGLLAGASNVASLLSRQSFGNRGPGPGPGAMQGGGLAMGALHQRGNLDAVGDLQQLDAPQDSQQQEMSCNQQHLLPQTPQQPRHTMKLENGDEWKSWSAWEG